MRRLAWQSPRPAALELPQYLDCVSTLGMAASRGVHDHRSHELYVQWLEHRRESGEVIVASVIASAGMTWAQCPQLAPREDAVLELAARGPGEIEVLRDAREPPGDERCVP